MGRFNKVRLSSQFGFSSLLPSAVWDSVARSPCPSASPISPSRVIVTVCAVFDHDIFVVFICVDVFDIFIIFLFYRECDISSTIDFIFGNAAAVFQNCNIYLRKPRKGEPNVITVQGQSDPNQNIGIVIQFFNISSNTELLPVRCTVRSYLGRPWMKYSRTVYMQNNIGRLIDPARWLLWNGDFALNTLYYAEFKNKGPGSRMSKWVKWPGYHIIVKSSLVRKFTVGNFIDNVWLPSTGCPLPPA
ncbi:hypothetical protein Taro_044187 [Colocasia esculenta]|uniref:Pectinesterase catalytic domain-containing protein n=1 Tax=Colocasia esculenta TaxID=4460 RepID=A0A843WN25_COLES|nr:hypothetical protein [Colocasia esculenta]